MRTIVAVLLFLCLAASADEEETTSIVPTQRFSARPNHFSFFADGDYLNFLSELATRAIGRKDVMVISAHGNGKAIFSAGKKPMSLSAVAQFITQQPTFKEIRVLFLNCCLAGSCPVNSSSIASRLLEEIHKLAPNHQLAVIAPTGIAVHGQVPRDDSSDSVDPSYRITSLKSEIRARKQKNPDLIKDINDRNAFVVVSWGSAETRPTTTQMTGSVLMDRFHWLPRSAVPKPRDPTVVAECERQLSQLLPKKNP